MSSKNFSCSFTISCETKDQAMQVLSERLGYDEDYGFDYQIQLDYDIKEKMSE